jgi:hypothetical protein
LRQKQSAQEIALKRRSAAVHLLATPLRRLFHARRHAAFVHWAAITALSRQRKVFALQQKKVTEAARRRYNICFCVGALAWLLFLALLYALFKSGHWTVAGAVRSARDYCASGPRIRSFACIDEAGCLTVLETRSSWLCAPADWLINPVPPALDTQLIPAEADAGLGYWFANEKPSKCASLGCGAEFVGT